MDLVTYIAKHIFINIRNKLPLNPLLVNDVEFVMISGIPQIKFYYNDDVNSFSLFPINKLYYDSPELRNALSDFVRVSKVKVE